MQARFKNLNTAEFYVYNLEEGTIDTLMAKDGRFAYTRSLSDTVTLHLLFPNFTEMPIFAAPGVAVKVEGDVSHLKETTIKGSEANELMTAFRLSTGELMPPEVVAEAERFIKEHVASPVSVYLLTRYFVSSVEPDYKKACALCDTLLKAQPSNIALVRLQQDLQTVRYSGVAKLSKFKAVSTKGDTVTNSNLRAEVNVMLLWSAANSLSTQTLHQLSNMQKDNGKRLGVMTISVDVSPDEGKMYLERDSVRWPNICDGQLWQSELLARLGLTNIGDNIVADKDGKIIARNLSTRDLKERVEALLKETSPATR